MRTTTVTTVKIVTTVKVKRVKKVKNPLYSNGFVIYDGLSMLDGKPIVVIVTGSRNPTKNPKTGAMLQTWIMRSDIHPVEALHNGSDVSVCGNCPLRPKGKDGTKRACYVNAIGLSVIYGQYKAGSYGSIPNYSLGLSARIGSYGDPSSVPIGVWRELMENVPFSTGYTRQWNNPKFQEFKKFCQASCHNLAEYQHAIALGWNAFIVRAIGDPVPMGSIQCPQVADPYIVTCASCKMCNGNTTSISVEVHGIGKQHI